MFYEPKEQCVFLAVRLRATAVVCQASKTWENRSMECRWNDIGTAQILKHELHLNIRHQFSSYLAVNTLLLH
jgi:hypothetical protein